MLYFINMDMFIGLRAVENLHGSSLRPKPSHAKWVFHTPQCQIIWPFTCTHFSKSECRNVSTACLPCQTNDRFSSVGRTIIRPPDRANILMFHIIHVRLILKKYCCALTCVVKYAKTRQTAEQVTCNVR